MENQCTVSKNKTWLWKDLTKAEEINERWQEYTEELYEKGLNDPDNHNDMVTYLEPDIWEFLVCIVLRPSMQDFKHDLPSTGDECSCPMLSTFFGTTLLGNWRRKWQPTRVFLPGKSCGWRSLSGYSPWGCRVRHD